MSTLDLEVLDFQHVSLLIRLRYYLGDKFVGTTESQIVYGLVEKLGFGANVAEEILGNRAYRGRVKTEIDHKLEQLQQQYEDRYGLGSEHLQPQDIENAFRDRILSLKVSSGFNNPYAILRMERYFDLPETGNLDLFTTNWNRVKYSPAQCDQYNNPFVCWIKAIQFNDMERFIEYYPDMKIKPGKIQDATFNAVSFGRIEILKYIIDDIGLEALRKELGHDFYGLLGSAIESSYDNVPMLKYMYSLGIGDGLNYEYVIGWVISYEFHINNLKFIISQPGVSQASIEKAMTIIARQGQDIDFYRQLENDPRLTQLIKEDQLDIFFYNALLGGNDQLVRHITLQANLEDDPDRTYRLIRRALLYSVNAHNHSPGYKGFRYLLTRPEVDKTMLKTFLISVKRDYRSSEEYNRRLIEELIIESGKLSQEEIDEAT